MQVVGNTIKYFRPRNYDNLPQRAKTMKSHRIYTDMIGSYAMKHIVILQENKT